MPPGVGFARLMVAPTQTADAPEIAAISGWILRFVVVSANAPDLTTLTGPEVVPAGMVTKIWLLLTMVNGTADPLMVTCVTGCVPENPDPVMFMASPIATQLDRLLITGGIV